MALPIAPLILGGVGALASGVGRLLPTEADRANKERLAELRRRQQLEGLGFTPSELEGLQRGLQAGAERQLSAARDAAAQSMANFAGSGAGVAADMATRAGEQQAQLQAQVDDRLVQLDLAERRRQEQELEDRLQRRGQRQLDVSTGIGEMIEDILGVASGGMSSAMLTEGAASSLASGLQLSPEEAALLERMLQGNRASTFQSLSDI